MKNFLNKHRYKIPFIISLFALLALYLGNNTATAFLVGSGLTSTFYIFYKDFTYTFTE